MDTVTLSVDEGTGHEELNQCNIGCDNILGDIGLNIGNALMMSRVSKSG